MAVPQVMDTNIRQIGELGAAGQLLVERCARHVEYAVVWGQPVEPGTVGAELFGQPMRNRHIAVSAFLAVLGGAEDVLPLFSVVGLIDAQLVIIGQVFRQQRQHLALAASCPEQNIKCQKIGLVAEFFPQKFILVFRDDKHFPGDGGTHVAGGIARIETQAVECLGIIEEGGQLCVDGVEVCFRIGEARGFAHVFYSLLPISNIKSSDLIHFPVSEKRNDFGVKTFRLVSIVVSRTWCSRSLKYVALNLELDAPIDTTTTMLVSTMPWESGTTEVVPGHSDGCCGNLTNGKYPYRVAGIEMQIGAYVEQLDPLWKASLVDDDHWHYDVFSCKSGEKQVGSISSDYAQTGSFDLNDKATWSWHYIRKLGKLGAEAMMYEKFNGSGSTYVRAAFSSPGSAGVYAPWRGGALLDGALCGLPCASGYNSPAHSYWYGVPRLAGSGKKRG